MDALQRVNIEMLAYQNGWEVIVSSTDESVVLRSALHSRELRVSMTREGEYRITTDITVDREEIHRLLGFDYFIGNTLRAWDSTSLSQVFETTAMLARALPDQPLQQYKKKLSNLTIDQTEVERVVKQRIGQDIFRSTLLDYWGGACALTGIRETALLRASHIKPWASCDSDDERLNVFNGFLLEARYDALFDQGLITFTDAGEILVSNSLDSITQQTLQLRMFPRLRWITPEHLEFLAFHRDYVFLDH
jgi:predicted restriction endonuclease